MWSLDVTISLGLMALRLLAARSSAVAAAAAALTTTTSAAARAAAADDGWRRFAVEMGARACASRTTQQNDWSEAKKRRPALLQPLCARMTPV